MQFDLLIPRQRDTLNLMLWKIFSVLTLK